MSSPAYRKSVHNFRRRLREHSTRTGWCNGFCVCSPAERINNKINNPVDILVITNNKNTSIDDMMLNLAFQNNAGGNPQLCKTALPERSR